MMVGRGPFRRRGLVIDAFVTGESLTDDFLRCELADMTTGELTLEPLDFVVLLLTVRSRAGATRAATAEAAPLLSSSGKRENQLSVGMYVSPWNMGEVSKLSVMKGDWSMSGEVMFVKVVEGGADWKGSAKMSLGDTVRVEPDTERGLMAVKAVGGASQETSCWRPAKRLAPESNELLLFRSGGSVSVGLSWAGTR
jgi:hypothetical protein